MLLHSFHLTILLLSTIPVTPQWGVVGDESGGSVAAAGPVVQGRPFTMVWNMPTASCQEQYGIHLDLGAFDIVENHHQCFQGQNMSIFYHNQLGLYPYISQEGLQVNGGVPQRGDLEAHLALAQTQISALLRTGFSGLAVIDWEEWRPLWVRDFGIKLEYRRLSKKLVRGEHPELTKQEVNSLARKEFERGARAFMSETLKLGVCLRPRGLWGFYSFPECFNYHRKQKGHSYTGHCHSKTRQKNDQLAWLWRQSTALYPSIYLPQRLAGSSDATLLVRHRLLEALRVANQYPTSTHATPVLPYARVAFAHTLHFLNKTDLEHTLGESAALGMAGVVLWGEQAFAKSKRQCEILRDYINSELGEYISTLKRGVQRCSEERCHGNGRCARRDPYSDHMIPLSDPFSNFLPDPSHYLSHLHANFLCQCYQGWAGEKCQERIASITNN
uniref:Hyaluronidase n=1 Tax=Hucho hucho TaxID=62062 RepID=A0A4W5RQ82_9TELE